MRYEVGERVLAIRDGDNTGLNIFGEGVYVGDLPRPGTEDGPSEIDREAILTVFAEDDAVPLAENRMTLFSVAVAEANGHDIEQARAASIAAVEAERAKPMEIRVQELWEATSANPCIHLDSGDVVWGFQCWWGPIDGANRKYPEDQIPRTVVPVPEGNGRWQE
jgi:hypothetical protein